MVLTGRSWIALRTLCTLCTLALPAGAAGAAEIRVLSAGAVKSVLTEVVPRFEQASGHLVHLDYAPAQPLNRRILAGESADVVINSTEALDELGASARIRTDSRRTLGVVGIGVAVRAGAPLPDISTESKFRETLLRARSISAVNPERGTSGRHFAAVLERLGIAAEVRSKLTLVDGGSAAQSVARGDIEIAVQQMSELMPVPGIAIAGPLPASLQKKTAYAGAVLSGAVDAAAAGAFIAYLASPEVRAVFRAKGFQPGD